MKSVIHDLGRAFFPILYILWSGWFRNFSHIHMYTHQAQCVLRSDGVDLCSLRSPLMMVLVPLI